MASSTATARACRCSGIAAQIPSARSAAAIFRKRIPNRCSRNAATIASSSRPARCRVCSIAIREAVGKRGVSVIVIPGDVALQPASDAPPPKVEGLLPPAVVTPSRADLDRLAALLNGNDAASPSCAARDAQGAHDELLSLGERLKAPMVHALRGKEHVEWDNPYDVGMTGLIGFSSGYYAMRDCDALLMLGTDFPYRQFYPEGSGVRIAQVDLRPRTRPPRSGRSRHRRRCAAQRFALLPLLKQKRDDTHLAQAREHYAKARKALDELAVGTPGKGPHPSAADRQGTQRPGRGGRHLHLRRRPADGMGRALSRDERQAAADRLVLAWLDGQRDGAGDRRAGRLSRSSGDLALGRRRLHHADGRLPDASCSYGLPVKVVVFNNGALGFIELEQKSTGFLDFGTDFKNPNFAAMAEAVGIKGIRLEDPAEVE